MQGMSKVMVTVKLDPAHASLDNARGRLGLNRGALDDDFGLIAVDPDEDLYAVLVEENGVEDMRRDEGISGPCSNPKIEPFGPPR